MLCKMWALSMLEQVITRTSLFYLASCTSIIPSIKCNGYLRCKWIFRHSSVQFIHPNHTHATVVHRALSANGCFMHFTFDSKMGIVVVPQCPIQISLWQLICSRLGAVGVGVDGEKGSRPISIARILSDDRDRTLLMLLSHCCCNLHCSTYYFNLAIDRINF